MLIDTHCHLDFPEFDRDRDEVIKRACDQGVTSIINVGSSILSSQRSLELSLKYQNVYSVVGIHPHEADSFDNKAQDAISRLAEDKKALAIGEIGLDYFKNFSRKTNQLRLFLYQINLAKKLNLPIVIHTRCAEEDTLKVLKEAMPIKAVVHCFSSGFEFLEEALRLGFFISFTSNITYKKADSLREMVKLVPLDRLMLETDAPFLSPEGFRGKRNEPMQIRLLAEFVAKIRGSSFDEIAKRTTGNALDFFRI